MMLKRKIINDLIKWKNNKEKKPLIVEGARQVGKTYIIEKFAKENYSSFLEINFLKRPDLNSIFEGNLEPSEIYSRINLRIPEFVLKPHETLIFLDEIQKCPEAITALKFLAEDGSYDIICSGSILGIGYARASSFPVGYVERLNMYPLDFEEFLWAMGMKEESISYIKTFFDNKKQIDDGLHTSMMDYFKNYIVIGGMPEVVEKFIDGKNYQEAFSKQREIIEDYREDIVKYAEKDEKSKIRACFDSIPKQLAKENKKFQYKLVEPKATYEKYYGALQWLADAGVISFCYNISKPELPLEGFARQEIFKVYMNDTGLLISMLGDNEIPAKIMSGDLGIYKGAIYENIIAQIFTSQGRKLYYFNYNGTLEIDFFISYKGNATAIEVKAADNTKSKSLDSVIKNWGVKQGIKLSSKNLGSTKEHIENIPLYMSIFLK